MALVKVGAFWIREGKKGGKFMSGEIEIGGKQTRLLILKNTRKEPGSKAPDYKAFIPDDEDRPRRQEPLEDDDSPF